ncbi:MAG: HAMP domain-containing histidine kinase [Muribaculaceae bacterium]|nr:HAMP domain-containing histidine kinase [Muribaculaceae bacterium]
MPTAIWIVIVVVFAVLVGLITTVIIRRNTVRKINYMFDAFEDGETNFKFRDDHALNKSLNRLRGIFERQKISNEQESWSKLIRVLTHEMMNTLAPVVSLTDSLNRHEKIRNDETLKASLDIISDSSRHLIQFVNTYRQLNGLSRPVKRKIDLIKIIDKTVKLNEPLLAEKNVTLSRHFPDTAVIVYADEFQISQVIQNLIKNAWQADARNIEFRLKILSDDTVVLWVRNDGMPIPVESQEQIFIPFYTTKEDGTGIGLSVCRQIMRYHKGSIELLRSNSSETIFELTFI